MQRKLLNYLSLRRADLVRLREFLAAYEFSEVALIARRIATTGRGFGIAGVPVAANRLADVCDQRDHEGAHQAVRELADVLFSLQQIS